MTNTKMVQVLFLANWKEFESGTFTILPKQQATMLERTGFCKKYREMPDEQEKPDESPKPEKKTGKREKAVSEPESEKAIIE